MAKIYSYSIIVIILTTIVFFNYCKGYEISSKDSHLRLSSQLDSSPRDQANYHHYRRSDHHDNQIPQQHHIAFNSIPKSNKYQGWKPIVSSRSLPAVKYFQKSTPQESHSQYAKSAVTESSPVNDPITEQAVLFIQQSSTEATVKPWKSPTNKIIKEDDIMWMHYGPVDDDQDQHDQPSTTEANLENDINYEKPNSEKQYHSQYRVKQSTKDLPKNIYEIIDHSPPTFKPIAAVSKGDGVAVNSSWKAINLDDKMQATETRSSIEAASSSSTSTSTSTSSDNDKYSSSSSVDLHTSNTLENEFDSMHSAKEATGPRKSDIYDAPDNERVIKINRNPSRSQPPVDPVDKNKNEQRYYTQMDIKSTPINVHPTAETPDENDEPDSWLLSYFRGQNHSAGKGGKFLGKPIVIAEQTQTQTQTQAQPSPYFTAEYYRTLFDSFSREDRSFDRRSSQNDSSHELKSSEQTNPKHRDQSGTSNETNANAQNCTSAGQTSCNKSSKNKNHQLSFKPHRRNHNFNVFKFMGIDVKDLMPKTLRTNIYIIKKLLTECYTELQDEDPSPIVCMKKITTKVLDNAIDSETIKLTDSVSLVKENVTSIVEHESSRSSSSNIDWISNTIEKMSRLFSTHSLRVQLVNSQEDHKYQIEGRRRHYRRVFPIVVGAYMILSTVLIPLGFKFMTLLGTKSLLLSKLSLMISLMGSIKKLFGYGTEAIVHSYYTPTYYPTAAHPPAYPSYYDPWRRDEFRKISNYDEPAIDYSHFSEEI
ncbi:uncharacterized protein LOC135839888 isoform X2 [Planococcus citri]|uniref:uncharacterized protein LOC135839888 isoform X2 n=1 Tax=Planococcus citri TaxID=170843 RepID=UPI0031F8DC22